MNFKKTINISGWIVFSICFFVYLFTIEASASWWDCGEFIATSYKMMVGHPPGAPFFQLIAKFFSFFAFGDVEKVAFMINLFSGTSTAFSGLFLFWSATMIIKKFFPKEKKEYSFIEKFLIIGASSIGAFACIFSDTVWFSGVEAEVYAFTLFLSSFGFWAVLKWEANYGKERNNIWIVFIAFITGISIGVHILNLMSLPALIFIIILKKYGVNIKSIFISTIMSLGIIILIYLVMYTGFFKIMNLIELLFVNSLGLPFNSGVWFTLILMFVLIFMVIWYSHKKQKSILNFLTICYLFVFIGYSSYMIIIIRAQSNITINENKPDSPSNIISYLNREQYGSRAIFWGPQFNSNVIDIKDGDAIYHKKNGKYVEVDKKRRIIYDPKQMYLFPRMFSQRESDVQNFEEWIGEKINTKKGPTFAQNLKYIFIHQLGFMNLRYFFWNFVGRQNDIQKRGVDYINGNWISGIGFIDSNKVGNQENLPERYKKNKARNFMFFLPLIIGLFGSFYSFKKNKLTAWGILVLFVFLGPVLTLATGNSVLEPRERDYVYSGQVYAFCIWIAIGVIYFYKLVKKYIKKPIVAYLVVGATFIMVPFNMAYSGWDDHNRSKRTLTRDMAKNYLLSCPKNAILITYGDNDTFPLWYVQEVEGIRTDVKVLVTSYLNTDWYINQARRKTYEAEAVKMTMPKEAYIYEKKSQVPVFEREELKDTYIELKNIIQFVSSEEDSRKVQTQSGRKINYFPTKNIKVTFDRNKYIEKGIVNKKFNDKILDGELKFKINGRGVMLGDLAILDMIGTNRFDRPICFTSVPNNVGLSEFVEQVGLVYKLVPIKTTKTGEYHGVFDVEKNYNLLMNKLDFSNFNDDIHIDWENIKFFLTTNPRAIFIRLAKSLANKGDTIRAEKVSDFVTSTLSIEKIGLPGQLLGIVEVYYSIGKRKKGSEVLEKIFNEANEISNYHFSLPRKLSRGLGDYEIQRNLYYQQYAVRIAQTNDSVLYNKFFPKFKKQSDKYQNRR